MPFPFQYEPGMYGQMPYGQGEPLDQIPRHMAPEPVDVMGAGGPAANVVGENKKKSIKEYLADIKARQAAGENVVPSFSNVTGSQVGQNVGFGGSGYEPAMDPNVGPSEFQRYGGAGEFNFDEYQEAPQGIGVRDPMGERNLIPGENFGDSPVGQEMAAEQSEKLKQMKNSGNYEKQAQAHLQELAPMIAAELGFNLEDGPQTKEQGRAFLKAIREAGEDFTVAWYRELDRAMELLKSGKFTGVEEYIAGGMKDPSLIKKEVAGQDFLIEMYKEGLTKYNDEELARDYAVRQQAMVKDLIKNGKLDDALKKDTTDPAAGGGSDPAAGGGALPSGAGLSPPDLGRAPAQGAGLSPPVLGRAPANAQPKRVQGPATQGSMTKTQRTPAGQMGAAPERLDEARQFAKMLRENGVDREEATRQLMERFPDLKDGGYL